MPYGGPPSEDIGPTQGIAGGPEPTPGGADAETARQAPPLEPLPPGEAQKEAGEVAERSAGNRAAEPDEDPSRGEK